MVKCMLYGSSWGQKYNLLTRRLPPLQHTNQKKADQCAQKHTQKRNALTHHLRAINSVISILSQAAEWLCTLNRIIFHSLTQTQIGSLRPVCHRSTCCPLCIRILLLGLAIQTWPCDPSHDWICYLSFKSSRAKHPCLLAPLWCMDESQGCKCRSKGVSLSVAISSLAIFHNLMSCLLTS